MQEIILESNNTGLRVFINGIPDLTLVPKEEADNAITALEIQIADFHKEKHQTACSCAVKKQPT